MQKVLIWDYIGQGKTFFDQFGIKDNTEVVKVIVPTDTEQDKTISETPFDYLLIFENGIRNMFNSMISMLKLPEEKVIYALDISNWLSHPKAMFDLVNPGTGMGGLIWRSFNLNLDKSINNFVTCTVEGVHYVATAKDTTIMNFMYTYGKNFSSDEINFFHGLLQKYYSIDLNRGGGYFLDIGANIGTTCVYLAKKIDKNLKILAFEPDEENYRLLKVNLLLNQLEDRAICENIGLGIEKSEQTLYRSLENPGGNSLYRYSEDLISEDIKIISLDSYIEENKIDPKEIKYLWMDTEGFEAQVILGAKKFLEKNPLPIFVELNPMYWEKWGFFDEMIDLLEKYYAKVIFVQESMKLGQDKIHSVDELRKFKNSTAWLGTLGDIFLIAK